MAEFTLWTLNRATPLVASRENALVDVFKKKDHLLHMGDRSGSDLNVLEGNDQQSFMWHAMRDEVGGYLAAGARSPELQEEFSSRHRLMHEGKEIDEYFVPIPLKVLGDVRNIDEAELSASGRDTLRAIKASDDNGYFRDDAWLEAYWNIGSHPNLQDFPKVRMNTARETRKGYYQILQDHQQLYPERRNILVGYSQGGLVARYLAAVDQFVFGGNLVAGVITIGSPNMGSPLANPDNREEVIAGMLQLAVSAMGLTIEKYPRFHAKLEGADGYDAKEVFEILDGMVEDIVVRARRDLSVDPSGIQSIRKWMSGIAGDPATAFRNLNVKNVDDPGSPLGLVNSMGVPNALFGSVVNADNRFRRIVGQVFPLSKFLDFIMKSVTLENVSSVYRDRVMNEKIDSPSSRVSQVLAQYDSGVDDAMGDMQEGDIEPRDHDFVIPSNSQLTGASPKLLGNLVNEHSNHLSGGTYTCSGGRSNYKMLKKLLERMADRL